MRKLRFFCLLTLIICLFPVVTTSAQEVISLEGSWDLSLNDSTHYDDYVMLPGSLLTNGKGDPVTADTRWTGSTYDSSYYFNPWMEQYRREGNVKFPFFLTPEKHFVGKAWYRKSVYIPRDWKNQRVTLFLERPHIETTVYVNGREVGHQMSLSTPHQYDVTQSHRECLRRTGLPQRHRPDARQLERYHRKDGTLQPTPAYHHQGGEDQPGTFGWYVAGEDTVRHQV